jgi:hypothetical protein
MSRILDSVLRRGLMNVRVGACRSELVNKEKRDMGMLEFI